MEEKRQPVIQVKNLYKIFRVGDEKVRALNGVDLTIYKGEFCAIVGTSGSGKSTMLNMLAGLEKPTKGEVVVAGQHLENMTENQLVKFRREKVGFIFQSFNLLGTMNAIENVALPLTFRGVDKKVREAKGSEDAEAGRTVQTYAAPAKRDVRWTAAKSRCGKSPCAGSGDYLRG